ncbi:MAG: cyclic nucleotide-binding domain-containing protein [Chloroflexota bacterium]
MPSDPKLDLLHSIPLFARLGKSDLQSLGQLADEIDMPAGRVLMREGELGREMFVVVSGKVRVERQGKTVAELGPGDWLGEMALLSEGNRTATVTTTEPTRLFVVAHREFHSLMYQMPTVRAAVDECVADRIRRLESDSAH